MTRKNFIYTFLILQTVFEYIKFIERKRGDLYESDTTGFRLSERTR